MYISTKQEVEKIKKSTADSLSRKLYEAIKKRLTLNTEKDGFVQSRDTNMQEHICWSRASDAALVVAVDNDVKTANWLHNAVLGLCRRSPEEWIGPWFRYKDPMLTGQLETSHMSLAVATALDLCPQIFSDEELDEIKKALREKGMMACRRYVVGIIEGQGHINNWFAVLLNGYGTSAAILDDAEAVNEAHQWLSYVTALYQKDSYGETLQYSNYTAIHFCHLMEVLMRWGIPENELPLETPARLIPWIATSHMYMKKLDGWGDYEIPRTINFGDSAAIFRPSANMLLQCASLLKTKMPREAALASHIFFQTYPDLDFPYDEGAEFGFVNNFSIHAVVRANEIAKSRTPEQVGLPTINIFENGQINIRDKWDDCNFVMGIQGGYASQNVCSHRHNDMNSFMLSAFGERMFTDPGHCCYRLQSQAFSLSTRAHNTWTIKHDGNELGQKPPEGNFFVRKQPVADLKAAGIFGDGILVSSDAAKAYGNLVKKAERTWVLFAPNIVYIIDRLEFTEPASVRTRFWANNHANRLSVNIAAQNKLVFRRGNTAVKLFSMGEREQKLDLDWSYVHDAYHPQPNQLGQGLEGSSLGYIFTTQDNTRHVNIYSMAIDLEPRITGWHMFKTDDGFIKVESPEKTAFKELKADWDKIVARNEQGEETNYHFEGEWTW